MVLQSFYTGIAIVRLDPISILHPSCYPGLPFRTQLLQLFASLALLIALVLSLLPVIKSVQGMHTAARYPRIFVAGCLFADCLLLVACCVSFVVRFIGCCLLFVVCCLLFVVCCLLLVAGCWLHLCECECVHCNECSVGRTSVRWCLV